MAVSIWGIQAVSADGGFMGIMDWLFKPTTGAPSDREARGGNDEPSDEEELWRIADRVSFHMCHGDLETLLELQPNDALIQALQHDYPNGGEMTVSMRVYWELEQKVKDMLQQVVAGRHEATDSLHGLVRKRHDPGKSWEDFESEFDDLAAESGEGEIRASELLQILETMSRSAEAQCSWLERKDADHE